MVLAGLIVDGLFSALGLVPTGSRPPSAVAHAGFRLDYNTFLNLPAVGSALVFFLDYTRLGKSLRWAYVEMKRGVIWQLRFGKNKVASDWKCD